jgi:hypothetical protein
MKHPYAQPSLSENTESQSELFQNQQTGHRNDSCRTAWLELIHQPWPKRQCGFLHLKNSESSLNLQVPTMATRWRL